MPGPVMTPSSIRPLFVLLCTLALVAGLFAEPGGIGFADAGRIAVEASQDLRHEAAMQAIRERSWSWGVRAYFPTLSLSAFEDDRLARMSSDSFQKNYALSLEQTLYDGGRLAASRKIERARLNLSVSQLEAARGDVFEAAVDAYRQLLLLREARSIRSRGLTGMQKQRDVLATKLSLGQIVKSDLTEADISVADSKISLLMTEIELREAEARFAELLAMEEPPPLLEKIDVKRPAIKVDVEAARSAASERNPELVAARLALREKEEAAKLAARSWLPAVKANGSFGLRGDKYPLTEFTWSVGLTFEFANPFVSGTAGGNLGYEGRDTKTARVYGTLTPLPDPAAYPLSREPGLVLALERSRFSLLAERTARAARLAVEQCAAAGEKRTLAVDSARLAGERFKHAKARFDLGQITSITLLEAQNEVTVKEIAAIEAAAAVLAAERSLEKMLGLLPGELVQLETR